MTADDDHPQLGRFEVRSRLGQGGMGRVYLARDPELGREVAIKVLRPEVAGDPEVARARLVREAQAMARVAHPNVIAVHEVGRTGDDVFVVMKHVAGGTLAGWLQAPRDWRACLEVIAQVADGLAAAHDAGLVHRDVKPDNILIGRDGRARITDFGLVGVEAAPNNEARDGDADARLTHTGMRLGTIGYMAPEQLEGGEATPRSDQFALCVTLFEALYGERPHAGTTYREIARAAIRGELRPPRRDRSVPPELDAIVRRGLAPDPTARWPDLGAFAGALRAVDRGPEDAAPATAIHAAPPPAALTTSTPMRRGAIIAAVGGVALLGAFGVSRLRSSSSPSSQAAPSSPWPPSPSAAPKAAATGRVLVDRPGCARWPTFLDEDRIVSGYAPTGDAGDLYVRDAATGQDRRLTTSPDVVERTPHVAIGEPAVYYVAQVQGSPSMAATRLALAPGATPVGLRSDTLFANPGVVGIGGDMFYVIGEGSTLVRLRGSTVSEVAVFPDERVWTIAPSTDGRYLALNTGRVCVLDLAEARPVRACVKKPAAYGRFVVDPTGRLVYYGAPEGVRVVSRTTGEEHVAVAGAGVNGGMALSPSGRRLAWSDCQPQIALTELAGKRVVHDESLTMASVNRRGMWTFIRETPSSSLLVSRDATGVVHELTAPPIVASAPAIEPDGERIVFARGDVPGLHLAYGVRQRPIERVTEGAGDEAPVWLPNERIAFTRMLGGFPEVWIADLARPGTAARAFEPGRKRITLDRQPGGDLVLLANDDRTRLYLWDPRANTETEVPQPPEFHGAPLIEAELSPDARHITVQRGPEIWRFPVAGGAATRLWVPPVGHAAWGVEVDHEDRVFVADGRDVGRIYLADLP